VFKDVGWRDEQGLSLGHRQERLQAAPGRQPSSTTQRGDGGTVPASSVSCSTTRPFSPRDLSSSLVSRSLFGVLEAPLPWGHGQRSPCFLEESPANWFNA